MNFSLPKTQPKITKEFLLKRNSEETYMSTYLGVPVKKGLSISGLRKDHKPTASFYRNRRKELIYHDFGIGFHGNFIDVVKYLYNCDYGDAMQRIAEDFRYVDSTREPIKIRPSNVVIEEKPDTRIQIEEQPFQENELKWWESFGVHKSTLKKFNVHSCKSVFLNGNYYKSSSQRTLIFGYYGGKKKDIELWRIYFPHNKEYRFLSNWSKNIVQGAKQLPNDIENLVITKSMKDCMNLYEQGITAIAPCSETVLIEPKAMEKLQGLTSNIIYIGDNDLPGVKGAHKYKKAYPFLRCVFIKRKYAKDISDLYKFVGLQDYNEAVEELKVIFNDKEKRETKHFWIF